MRRLSAPPSLAAAVAARAREASAAQAWAGAGAARAAPGEPDETARPVHEPRARPARARTACCVGTNSALRKEQRNFNLPWCDQDLLGVSGERIRRRFRPRVDRVLGWPARHDHGAKRCAGRIEGEFGVEALAGDEC